MAQCLQNSRDLGYVMSLLFWTVILPESSRFVRRANQVGQFYYNAEPEEKRRMGSPHLSIFDGIVRETAHHPSLINEDQQALQAYFDMSDNRDELMKHVKLCRVNKTFKRETDAEQKYRVQMGVTGRIVSELMDIIIRLMESDGGEVIFS